MIVVKPIIPVIMIVPILLKNSLTEPPAAIYITTVVIPSKITIDKFG